MALYLAIDAGGTKTRCLLANEERVLALAETGTVKLMRVAEAEATSRLRAVLAEAAAGAEVSLDQVRRTCFGLAGSRSESVQQWARRAVGDFVSGELIVCGDEAIALDAAFAGGPGILVIAGTGSHAIGRTEDGTLVSAGGWGPVLGDEGSGYWIGLEAVRAALRAKDAGDDGASVELLREIEQAFGLHSLGELIALGNQRVVSNEISPPDFASLAPIIAAHAATGNTIALDILQRAGEELAGLVTLLVGKAGAKPADTPASIQVAFTGGVLSEISLVRASFVAALSANIRGAKVREPAVDPLAGALWRARDC
ncbi:MAG TPA: BadF/BadG/BcrA/BcrD ATPase family protein [Acidobacteriaceae bacterium]